MKPDEQAVELLVPAAASKEPFPRRFGERRQAPTTASIRISLARMKLVEWATTDAPKRLRSLNLGQA